MCDFDIAGNVTQFAFSQPIHVFLTDRGLKLVGLLTFGYAESTEKAWQMSETLAVASKSQYHVPVHGKVKGLVDFSADRIPGASSPEHGFLRDEIGPRDGSGIVFRKDPVVDDPIFFVDQQSITVYNIHLGVLFEILSDVVQTPRQEDIV